MKCRWRAMARCAGAVLLLIAMLLLFTALSWSQAAAETLVVYAPVAPSPAIAGPVPVLALRQVAVIDDKPLLKLDSFSFNAAQTVSPSTVTGAGCSYLIVAGRNGNLYADADLIGLLGRAGAGENASSYGLLVGLSTDTKIPLITNLLRKVPGDARPGFGRNFAADQWTVYAVWPLKRE